MSWLDREHTVARPGYSRWLVPPAALAIHLCIGQAYALSVFNLPLTKVIGVTRSAPGDWKLTSVAVIFSVAMVFLGLSAAVFGTWLERVGPRKAMFAAACCFGGGAMIGSPLAVVLMKNFSSPTSVGVIPAMVAMGIIYFAFMMFGVFTVRVPQAGWKPAGWTPNATAQRLVTKADVSAGDAIKT